MSKDATIISATLDTKELQKSIDEMVTKFDQGLQNMLDHTNRKVTEINNALKQISNATFDSKGSKDGVVGNTSKQVQKQNEVTKAVKETAMSYDKLLGALQMAQRQERLLSSKNLFSLSREDLDKYADAIKRVEELQEKLNAKTREMALGNVMKHQGVTDMREYITSLMKPNESLKRLNDDYKEWEKTSKQATQAATKDFANYSEEILKQAERIRNNAAFKKTGVFQWTEESGDVMRVFANEKKYGSIEEQLVQMQQIRINNAKEIFGVEEKTTEKASDLERIRERQLKAQEEYLASRKTEAEIQAEIQKNAKSAADALSQSKRNQGNIQNLSTDFRYEATIDELNRLREAYSKLDADTKRSPFGKELKSYINGLEKSLVSLGDKMRDESLMSANIGESYVRLAQKLNRLQTVYSQLNETERNSDYGNKVAESIQRTSRAMQQIQNQKARPKNMRDVLGLDEKTLDDIAYKMQMLQRYRSGLDTNAQKSEISQVNDELKRLQKTQREVMGENESLLKSNNALARSFNYMKNRLAFYFTVGASTAFVKKLIEIRSQYELTERALGILVDSASRGSRIFNELSNMSLMSPYTLIELSNAAKQLTAFDIAAKDVVDTTRRLADMAAAVGAPIERLTYALGQIKAYGYLNSRDARMFANAGIPLVKELSNYYSELEGRMVTVADVYDKMKKKAIDYSDVMNVVNKLTDEGGKFYDFQAKMADTLKVKLANLNLAYNNMLNDMGKSDGGILQNSIKGVTLMMKHWREISRVIGTVVTTLGAYKTLQAITFTQGAKYLVSGTKAIRNFALGFTMLARTSGIATASLVALRTAISSIPFIGWATAITAILSYFAWFNRSADETAQKMKEISEAMNGIRKEASDLYVDAIKTDNFGVQINKLKDLLELAETELHITIPVNIENVNESNIREKLRFVTNEVEKYINFSQRFSEEAVGSDYNERFENYGNAARTLYSSITESVNTVIQSLTELQEKGKASAEEVSALYELLQGKLQDESDVEYLQRIVELYERLGLLSERNQSKKSDSGLYVDTWREDIRRQGSVIERYNIKNWEVFFNMLKDSQDYFLNSKTAAKEFEEQIDRIGKKIDLNNIPESERTLKLQVAIEQEAARNNWNEFAVQYAKQIANEKFGTQIVISDKSKKNAEAELQEWQKQIQQWAKENGISFTISFQADDTPKEFADRMGKEWKDAVANYEVLSRKGTYGLATDTEIQTAKFLAEERKKLAAAAGYDTSDKKTQRKTAESELQKALKEEIQLLDKARSIYKQLTKEGVESNRALAISTEGYEDTIKHINSVLQKYGIPKFNLASYAGVQNPHAIMELLQNQLDTLVKSGVAKPEEIKELQVKLKDVKVDEVSFNQKTFTNSINNELGKLKEEYELAVELDANPELGGIFADMMGLSKDEIRNLPRTYSQLAVKIQDSIDKVFDGNNIEGKIDITKMLNKEDFDKWAKERGNEIDDAFIESINKVREYLNKVRLDEAKETIKNWSNLVEKYGNIQDRVLKIYKDTVNEQVDVIRQFGNEKDVINAIDIADKINVSNSPEQIARLQKELAELIKKVTEGKDTAISINAAIEKEGSKSKAKAIWDDFKNSDEYAQMFDNLEYLSTSSIQHILDKLEELKDKVKEDPASMKAYFDQLQTARDALVKANPFKGASEGFKLATEGIKEYFSAINESGKIKKDLNEAKEELKLAKQSVVEAIQEYGKFQDKPNADIDARLKAQNKLNNAKKAEKDAQRKVNTLTEQQAQNENKLAVAIKKIKSGIDLAKKGGENLADKLGDLSGALSSIGDMFKAFGDDDTAEAINDINTGFQVMQSVIMAVVGAIIILQAMASPILVAMTALVGLFIGIAALFSGAQNRAINREIEKSEASVRKLENAYKDLEAAIKYAYGAEEYGLKQAELANKKLQLAEIKRQLELERSRTGKHYDQEKVDEYIAKEKDLENEIAEMTHNIVEELLGISSVGDAAEELVSSMIDAFRKGEDYMANYAETFENMIENMIVQAIASRVIGDRLQQIWDVVDANINARTEGANADIAKYTQAITEDEKNYDNALQEYNRIKDASWLISDEQKQAAKKQMEFYKQQLEADKNALAAATLAAEEAGRITPADVDSIRTMSEGFKDGVMSDFEAWMEAFGIYRGDLAEAENLSNLQQGIQGITEDTAGALEAYMNGVSQQVYLHGDLLTQIRDTLVSWDMDVQLATQAQILLQLQASYQVQMSIQSTLAGWSNASGQAVRVEMI